VSLNNRRITVPLFVIIMIVIIIAII